MIRNPYLVAIAGGGATAVVGVSALAALVSPAAAIGFVAALLLVGFALYR